MSWSYRSVFVIVLLLPAAVLADEPAFGKKTYVYNKSGDVPVQADVHRAADGKTRPVVVWIHGGALIVGSRRDVPANILKLCREEGYILVSIDYRLAPEVKLPEIIADLKD